MKKIIIIGLAFCWLFTSCSDSQKKEAASGKAIDKHKFTAPAFNADSAYMFVKKQVDFGPRVPNTPNHSMCADYLINTLITYADTTIVQSFKTAAYDGTVLNGKNIIGSFNPEKAKRILLCAHWDSRPYADHDPDPALHNTPIDGANDGASGVGVLLEIGRLISVTNPSVGVDIIFFDLEDYGPPKDYSGNNQQDQYGLGSQYWSKNLHDPDYTASYGILLDMVGAANARFYMEGYSLMYAPGILKKIWNTAQRAGYGEYFMFEQVGYIDDDHKYVNEIARIPMIDIIHLDPDSSNKSFFEYWHTTGDNLSVIDKQTLNAVGQTLLKVIFEEK